MNYVELPELPEPFAVIDSTGEIHYDVNEWIGSPAFNYIQMKQYALLACGDLQRQLASLTEDYKDLEAQLLAVGAGGVSKLIGDKE